MYGGIFAFQNRLSWLVVGRKFTIFALFCFVFDGKFQVQAPWRAHIQRGDLTEGFLHYDFGGLIHGGAYFRNFMVLLVQTRTWSTTDVRSCKWSVLLSSTAKDLLHVDSLDLRFFTT